MVDGEPRIVSDPPLIVPIYELSPRGTRRLDPRSRSLFRTYRALAPGRSQRAARGLSLVDLARKVVGVGSVGTRCWILLLLGKDNEDPLFLQVKEARASVLEPGSAAAGSATTGSGSLRVSA